MKVQLGHLLCICDEACGTRDLEELQGPVSDVFALFAVIVCVDERCHSGGGFHLIKTELLLQRLDPVINGRSDHCLLLMFRHPGYLGPTNVLLALAKSDCEDRDGKVIFGLHHETALLACQIIANNAFNSGYFARDSAGFQRVNVPVGDAGPDIPREERTEEILANI
ncbi:hypothetical protein HDV63DRAFT_390338 [Trichoderma sp. SZMC 28014]